MTVAQVWFTGSKHWTVYIELYKWRCMWFYSMWLNGDVYGMWIATQKIFKKEQMEHTWRYKNIE